MYGCGGGAGAPGGGPGYAILILPGGGGSTIFSSIMAMRLWAMVALMADDAVIMVSVCGAGAPAVFCNNRVAFYEHYAGMSTSDSWNSAALSLFFAPGSGSKCPIIPANTTGCGNRAGSGVCRYGVGTSVSHSMPSRAQVADRRWRVAVLWAFANCRVGCGMCCGPARQHPKQSRLLRLFGWIGVCTGGQQHAPGAVFVVFAGKLQWRIAILIAIRPLATPLRCHACHWPPPLAEGFALCHCEPPNRPRPL